MDWNRRVAERVGSVIVVDMRQRAENKLPCDSRCNAECPNLAYHEGAWPLTY